MKGMDFLKTVATTVADTIATQQEGTENEATELSNESSAVTPTELPSVTNDVAPLAEQAAQDNEVLTSAAVEVAETEAVKKAEAENLAVKKAATEAAKKAEAEKLAVKKAAAEAVKKAEAEKLAVKKAATEAAEKAEAEKLALKKRATEAAKKAAAEKLALKSKETEAQEARVVANARVSLGTEPASKRPCTKDTRSPVTHSGGQKYLGFT